MVSVVIAAVTGSERAVVAALSSAVLLIPVSAIFRCARGGPRTAMLLYVSVTVCAVVVAVAGLAEVRWSAAGIALIMSVLGSWVGKHVTLGQSLRPNSDVKTASIARGGVTCGGLSSQLPRSA